MGTNALRPAAARKMLDLGPTAHHEKVRDGEAPQPGKLSDGGSATIFFEDEQHLYLEFRRDKRDGRIDPDMTWVEYHERDCAKKEGRPVDKVKVKAFLEFREGKKAGKIAENERWSDWYAARLAKNR
jgi:hypothetical protein